MEPTHFTLGLFGKQNYLLALVSFQPSCPQNTKTLQVPQNSRTALCALCTDLFAPQNHPELLQFLSWTRPEAKLRCKTWQGPSHEAAILALPSTLHLQWQWLISPCCHSILAEMPLISNTISKQVSPLHLPLSLPFNRVPAWEEEQDVSKEKWERMRARGKKKLVGEKGKMHRRKAISQTDWERWVAETSCSQLWLRSE